MQVKLKTLETQAGRGQPSCASAGPPHKPSDTFGPRCPIGGPIPGKPAQRSRWAPRIVVSLIALCCFAGLFVGINLLEHFLFTTVSTGVRHALLTIQAAVVTAIIAGSVFAVMRRQQRRLADTAKQLTQLLISFQENPRTAGRFQNPNLASCRDVLSCMKTNCTVRNGSDQRCWQELALNHPSRDPSQANVTLRECQTCDVYRQSCPDAMTELGEGINNLIYLLEQGAGELGRMREEMVEKQKMAAIGQISAGVAHEVCNPLSSISSVVQMMRRNRGGADQTAQLDVIDTHIRRISDIVRQLTKLSQPEADRFEPVDLGEILEETVRLVSFDPRAEKVKIVFDRPQDLPTTYGAPALLQQVALNLALNALDAMPDGGVLTFRVETGDDRIVLQIEDSGCGIAADVGRRVFEPFYTTKEPGRGTGLGLSASYSIVQKHAGTIDYASTPGEGTVFTVEIPIRRETARG